MYLTFAFTQLCNFSQILSVYWKTKHLSLQWGWIKSTVNKMLSLDKFLTNKM